eukprot:UN23498
MMYTTDVKLEHDSEEEDGWSEDNGPYQCLFTNDIVKSVNEVFNDAKTKHNFDFFQMKKDLKLDFYGCMKLINYIRTCVEKKRIALK